ncbi:unnamed protein product [Closterium sp. NIES-53]
MGYNTSRCPCAVRPCSHSVALPCSYSHCLPPARRALLQPASRALLPCPARAALPCSPRPAALQPVHCSALPLGLRAALPCSSRAPPPCPAAQRVAPCCPAQRAPHCPARRALLQAARRALLPYASRLAAARSLCSAAPRIAPCCSPRVAPYCPARRALLQPERCALLLHASRPIAAHALHSAAPRIAPCYSPRVAPCCPRRPARAAPPSPSRHVQPEPPCCCCSCYCCCWGRCCWECWRCRRPAPHSRPAATTTAAHAHATAATSGGAPGSARGAAGAGGAGGAAGSTGGVAGAGVARPTTDSHCLSWPLSRQLQQPGVDSSGHCLSWTTPPLSSFRCVRGSIEAAPLGSICAGALGASASTATGPASAEALHTFTLDSGAPRCFFRDCTTVTPLTTPVPVSLADPTGGPVVARASTDLPCPAVPSGSGGCIKSSVCVWSACSVLLVSGTLSPDSTLAPQPRSPLAAASPHHALPSPCLLPSRRAAPHSSEFPPNTAPLQTLYMDVWGPAPVGGTDQERYVLLVVDDYTRYTTNFPLRRKADVSGVLIPCIRATHRQLRERFRWNFPVMRLHSDRGGEFSSGLLAEFCQDKGIRQSFTLPASPQKNGTAERCIGLIMEIARTSMIHAAVPHFLWLFAVRYAAQQLNLWPRVSEPETSPTLRWTGKVGDALVFRVWGALSLVRDAKASKLSSRTLRCVFLGFPTDAPPWQFYHPCARRVSSSQDVTFDESVSFYRLHPHTSHPPGDLVADDTAATHRSPRLETPFGFLPRPSSSPPQPADVDCGAETAGAEFGGAETKGEGSWGDAPGGAGSGATAA